MILTGLDRLLAEADTLAGRSYGLLGHGASLTKDGRPAHLALAASKAGRPAALFGPEHGYYGVEQDMIASADAHDPWTGAPIVSLYGDSEKSLRPRPEAFSGLDVLLIDLQDVGSRYYTYAATAVWAAEIALAAGLEVWVLDRPNPLGGVVVEGNLIEPGYDSFVGAFSVPVRHGLTLGELVLLESDRRGWGKDGLFIWEMQGWNRTMLWPDTGLPWVQPSPNMPTFDTAQVYPGGCLVEATALSEGRGTTRPFELVGASGAEPLKIVTDLEALSLPGVRFLPTFFKPQFQKHRAQVCGGVQLLVTMPHCFPPYRTGVELLFAFRTQLGDVFSWRRDAYEFVVDRPAIDLLTGSCHCRLAIDNADAPALADWIASWEVDELIFCEERNQIMLYN
jgi:uncharacterized protein YbbC (DUF1343 family)